MMTSPRYIPVSRRCPHGLNEHICATCVAAEKSAERYAQRMRDKSPRISARKIPLEGWIAQLWVDSFNRWFDLRGCPVFQNPDDAVNWGLSDINAH